MGWFQVLAIFVMTSVVGPNLATDPVYTPLSLSDTAGNQADNNSDITWADIPTGSAYQGGDVQTVSGGMKPFYDLTRSFINTIFPQDLPSDVVEKLMDGDISSLAQNYSQYVSFFIGFAICLVIGILFLIIFPIVACCFCCCRCCGKCGGKMFQDEEDAKNSCKRYTYIGILLCLLLIIAAGAACVYVNNDLTSKAVNQTPSTVKKLISDLEIFVNNTIDEANHVVSNNFNFMKLALERDLDNIDFLVGLPLRVYIEDNTGLSATFTSAYTLEAALQDASTAFSDVETKKTDLENKLDALSTALTNSKNNIDNALSTCGSSCPGGSPDTSSLTVGVDQTQLPDLTGQSNSMTSATADNITAKIVDAENELNNIPETVKNDANPTVVDIKTKLNDVKDDLTPITNNINDLRNLISGENAAVDLEDYKDKVDKYGDYGTQYDKYRWYGGLALACIVLLVFVLAFFGLVFGLVGHTDVDPTERGCVSHHGGNLLMASVGFIFIFSALMMLLTVLVFLIGAPIERFICQPAVEPSLSTMESLIDNTVNKKLAGEGKYYFGGVIAGNDTTPITFTGLLRDCRNGETAFNAFRLDTRFDLNATLDYTQTLNVTAEIDKVNVDLSTVEVYPATLQTQMADLKDAVDINFNDFYTELGNSPTNTDLGTFADALETYSNNLNTANPVANTAKTALDVEVTEIRRIQTAEYQDVTDAINALNNSVKAMETAVSDIPTLVNNLNTSLQNAETFIQASASAHVTTLLDAYATRVLKVPNNFVEYTLDAMYNKIGKCNIVWNLYDAVLVKTFCYNMMDVLNGFWFSLGWCVFFFMPSLIFSVKLAKHFRRMDVSDRYDDHPKPDGGFDGPVVSPSNTNYTSAIHKLRNNKVAHMDDSCSSSQQQAGSMTSDADVPTPPLPIHGRDVDTISRAVIPSALIYPQYLVLPSAPPAEEDIQQSTTELKPEIDTTEPEVMPALWSEGTKMSIIADHEGKDGNLETLPNSREEYDVTEHQRADDGLNNQRRAKSPQPSDKINDSDKTEPCSGQENKVEQNSTEPSANNKPLEPEW